MSTHRISAPEALTIGAIALPWTGARGLRSTSSVTLPQLAMELAAGRTSSRALIEECLARIAAPGGRGPACFSQGSR